MGTVYFCTEREFPRGDAGSNRILHMAKALQLKGWHIEVFSLGHSKEEHYHGGMYSYQNVNYLTAPERKGGKLGRIFRRLTASLFFVDELKKRKPQQGDVIIVYSSSYYFCKPLYTYASKLKGVKILFDVVEWHQEYQFNTISRKYIYKSFKKCFDRLYPASGEVIVISELLKRHFEEKGCRVLKLPIYITPDDQCATGSGDDEPLTLIYPGNPYQKDSLKTMLEALELVPNDGGRTVKLHLTGVSKKALYMCIPGDEDLLNQLIYKGIVVVHEWMEYEDLMMLYDTIDFALIARPDNIVTRANFPSKVPELMNRGIPVIISSVGDITEYLSDRVNAILVPDCTAEKTKEAISYCIALDKKEIMHMHFNAKECAKNRFDYRIMANEIDTFLRQ